MIVLDRNYFSDKNILSNEETESITYKINDKVYKIYKGQYIYKILKVYTSYRKYLENKNNPLFIYELFSILQEILDCEMVGDLKIKILEKRKGNK